MWMHDRALPVTGYATAVTPLTAILALPQRRTSTYVLRME